MNFEKCDFVNLYAKDKLTCDEFLWKLIFWKILKIVNLLNSRLVFDYEEISDFIDAIKLFINLIHF